jgi:HNH endonuclease
MVCIWCKAVNPPTSLEHIIPEALGCPKGFVLPGGIVCRDCNNGLAHLDQAVIDEFDFLTFMSGVPRKKGRSPEIRNRGNVIATKGAAGTEISFNMNPYPVTGHDGTKLGGFRKSERNIQASFATNGPYAKISFSRSLGKNPKFVRGITKIALSSLAYFLGENVANLADFDPVRAFVRKGIGHRPVLIRPSGTAAYSNQVWPPFQSKAGEYAVTFRLAVMEFGVDLSPEFTAFDRFKAMAQQIHGDSGWTCLPIDG